MTRTLEVALVQTRTPATHAAALAHVEPLIRRAAAGGAKLVLTPEGTNILEQRREKRLAAVTDGAEGRGALPADTRSGHDGVLECTGGDTDVVTHFSNGDASREE